MVFIIFILLFIIIVLLNDNYECYTINDINYMLDDITKKSTYNIYKGRDVSDNKDLIYNISNTFKTPYSTYILSERNDIKSKISRIDNPYDIITKPSIYLYCL